MKRDRIFTLVLCCALALGGCSSQSTPGPAAGGKITVLAAASLTAAFGEIGGMFEAAHPGVRVAFSFAGSQQLAQQIGQGAPADVFASANPAQMDAAVRTGRIDPGAPRVFAANRLVVIVPKDNPGGITRLEDLAKPGLKLDLAAAQVPVGQYTLDFLDKASDAPSFGADFKTRVLASVVSYEDNVKAVVTKVSLGEADAGVVYATDAAGAQVTRLEIPEEYNVVALYPIAVLKDSPSPDLAGAFVDLVLSPEGQAVLEKYGFGEKR